MTVISQMMAAATLADSFATSRRAITIVLAPSEIRVIGLRFGKEKRTIGLRWPTIDGRPEKIVEAVQAMGRWVTAVPDRLDVEGCPQCGAFSGDDWSQCGGSCPIPGSPHYEPAP